MRSYRVFEKSIFCLFMLFIFYSMAIVPDFAFAKNRQAGFRYYEDKFEISVPALPTKYDNLIHNLYDAKIEILDGKVLISDLVPDQVYNGVLITFNDDIGRKYELKFDNVITSQPTKPHNKFIYDAYENGLGRKPEHEGFKFWYKKLRDFEISSVDFVMEMINSDEFNSNYKTSNEKINSLYKIIVGREPDYDGFDYWSSEFLNLVNSGLIERQAIIKLAEQMVKSDEFKSNVDKTGFLYI